MGGLIRLRRKWRHRAPLVPYDEIQAAKEEARRTVHWLLHDDVVEVPADMLPGLHRALPNFGVVPHETEAFVQRQHNTIYGRVSVFDPQRPATFRVRSVLPVCLLCSSTVRQGLPSRLVQTRQTLEVAAILAASALFTWTLVVINQPTMCLTRIKFVVCLPASTWFHSKLVDASVHLVLPHVDFALLGHLPVPCTLHCCLPMSNMGTACCTTALAHAGTRVGDSARHAARIAIADRVRRISDVHHLI
jgi:hypothetical protein